MWWRIKPDRVPRIWRRLRIRLWRRAVRWATRGYLRTTSDSMAYIKVTARKDIDTVLIAHGLRRKP